MGTRPELTETGLCDLSPVDHEIQAVCGLHDETLASQLHRNLCAGPVPAKAQLVDQAPSVGALQEPGTEATMYLDRGADHLARQPPPSIVQASHSVHPLCSLCLCGENRTPGPTLSLFQERRLRPTRATKGRPDRTIPRQRTSDRGSGGPHDRVSCQRSRTHLLSGGVGCVGVVPGGGEVTREFIEEGGLLGREARLRGRDGIEVLTGAGEVSEAEVEPVFKGVGDEAVLGIDEVVLFECALGFVLGCLEAEARLVDGLEVGLVSLLEGEPGGVDGVWFERSTELVADVLVDELGAEGDTAPGGCGGSAAA